MTTLQEWIESTFTDKEILDSYKAAWNDESSILAMVKNCNVVGIKNSRLTPTILLQYLYDAVPRTGQTFQTFQDNYKASRGGAAITLKDVVESMPRLLANCIVFEMDPPANPFQLRYHSGRYNDKLLTLSIFYTKDGRFCGQVSNINQKTERSLFKKIKGTKNTRQKKKTNESKKQTTQAQAKIVDQPKPHTSTTWNYRKIQRAIWDTYSIYDLVFNRDLSGTIASLLLSFLNDDTRSRTIVEFNKYLTEFGLLPIPPGERHNAIQNIIATFERTLGQDRPVIPPVIQQVRQLQIPLQNRQARPPQQNKQQAPKVVVVEPVPLQIQISPLQPKTKKSDSTGKKKSSGMDAITSVRLKEYISPPDTWKLHKVNNNGFGFFNCVRRYTKKPLYPDTPEGLKQLRSDVGEALQKYLIQSSDFVFTISLHHGMTDHDIRRILNKYVFSQVTSFQITTDDGELYTISSSKDSLLFIKQFLNKYKYIIEFNQIFGRFDDFHNIDDYTIMKVYKGMARTAEELLFLLPYEPFNVNCILMTSEDFSYEGIKKSGSTFVDGLDTIIIVRQGDTFYDLTSPDKDTFITRLFL